MPPMGLFPKPNDSWPTWAKIIYWTFVAAVAAFVVFKTIIQSFSKGAPMHVGIRMRFGKPVRMTPLKKGEYCKICTPRRQSSCPLCSRGVYCADMNTCPTCPVHDELKLVDSGLRWVVPFTNSIEWQSIADNVQDLTARPLEYRLLNGDREQVECDGQIIWSVPYRSRELFAALFKAHEINESVRALGERCLQTAVQEAKSRNDVDAISAHATALFKDLDLYNVKVLIFQPFAVARTQAQVLAGQNNMAAKSLIIESND